MTSWALVADVYFLPPQSMREGETSADFANRVQAMIAEVAGLQIVPWDGYLKYYNLAEKVWSGPARPWLTRCDLWGPTRADVAARLHGFAHLLGSSCRVPYLANVVALYVAAAHSSLRNAAATARGGAPEHHCQGPAGQFRRGCVGFVAGSLRAIGQGCKRPPV